LARELSPPEVDPATAAFAPVFRFIDMHLHLPMSRGELAARAGLSPSRFHARFVQLTGVSPMAWVRQRRLARAAGLVESGTMGMAQIAEQVGLCDAYHLNKLFRAVYGVPPSTMRRQANARAR
jgi:transcriptional regulator GlxA family with amidase domain